LSEFEKKNPVESLFCLVRGVLLPFIIILFTALCSALVLLDAFTTRKRTWQTGVLHFWAKSLVRLSGLRLKVSGLENIPAGGVVYVFNHQSLFDIPVVHAAIPRDFRYGAKTELYKIPGFGATMTAMGVIPIARANRSEAIHALAVAATRIQKGESFILAPEGTRQKESRIGEFKSGPVCSRNQLSSASRAYSIKRPS
jgi:1-acyl-sn-glycerol-3-phosphate acyltransferase